MGERQQLLADLHRRFPDGYMSLSSFAKYIGKSYPTVCRWRDSGKITAIQVGGIWRVYHTDTVDLLLQGNADSRPSRVVDLSQ